MPNTFNVTLTGHNQPVIGLAFTQDHSHLLSSSKDGDLSIWNPFTHWSKRTFFKNEGAFFAFIQLSKDLVAVSSNIHVNIWSLSSINMAPYDLLSSDHTSRHKHVTCLALSQDNSILASGSEDFDIMLWNYRRSSRFFNSLVGHRDAVRSVCFISNQILASGSDDETIKIWNVTSGIQNF